MEEILAVAAALHVVAEGFVLRGGVVQCGDGLRVEAVDGAEHPPETRSEKISALGEEVVERRTGELEPGVGVADAE